MRIELVSMGRLGVARRLLRRSGLRLTVRYGRVYTVRAVVGRQPDSEAQMRMRGVMARASVLAKRELECEERRLYWMEHAAELGYKTARGACVAYHMRRLREDVSEVANVADVNLAGVVNVADVVSEVSGMNYRWVRDYYVGSMDVVVPKRVAGRMWSSPPEVVRWRRCLARGMVDVVFVD